MLVLVCVRCTLVPPLGTTVVYFSVRSFSHPHLAEEDRWRRLEVRSESRTEAAALLLLVMPSWRLDEWVMYLFF